MCVSRITCLLLACFFALVTPPVFAETAEPALKYAVPPPQTKGFVARIDLHTAEEIEVMLRRAELYLEASENYPDQEPIVVILHGPELQLFNRRNYGRYKDIVGLAARLDALNVINVQVCEVQMAVEGLSINDLPHFVETIPYGPDEKTRLLKKGYQYF